MEFNTIQDFRRNFTQVYHSSVAPELDAFEKTKEQQKMKVNIVYIVGVIVIAIILYIFNFKFTQECTTLIVFTIMTCFSLKKWFCKKFEKNQLTWLSRCDRLNELSLRRKALGDRESTIKTEKVNKGLMHKTRRFLK